MMLWLLLDPIELKDETLAPLIALFRRFEEEDPPAAGC